VLVLLLPALSPLAAPLLAVAPVLDALFPLLRLLEDDVFFDMYYLLNSPNRSATASGDATYRSGSGGGGSS